MVKEGGGRADEEEKKRMITEALPGKVEGGAEKKQARRDSVPSACGCWSNPLFVECVFVCTRGRGLVS